MSLTFAPEFIPSLDIAGWTLQCGCGQAQAPSIFNTYEEAAALLIVAKTRGLAAVGLSCPGDYCTEMESVFTHAIEKAERPQVNMANLNAKHLLEVLGYGTDEATMWEHPSVAPEDFKGRVLVAMALNPRDAGVPAYDMAGDGLRMVNCGRHEGYTDEKLVDLLAVAEWAVTHSWPIYWS